MISNCKLEHFLTAIGISVINYTSKKNLIIHAKRIVWIKIQTKYVNRKRGLQNNVSFNQKLFSSKK